MIENEYGVKTKPDSPGNRQENAIISRINQVLGNLVRTYHLQETYVDDADPWMGIPEAATSVVQSTYQSTKGKSIGQLVFVRSMILPINHLACWRYICQHKQVQINKDVICENTTIIYPNYGVGDTIMIKTKSAHKYKTPFKSLYVIVKTWTNGTVTLRTGSVTNRIIICNIKPYNKTNM